jgi:hypothetical protein
VDDVLGLRRLAALARAPMLVRTGADTAPGALQLLRESGAVGVVLDVSDVAKLGGLTKSIESLPERGRKPQDKSEALVPAQAMAGGHDEDDDDDD